MVRVKICGITSVGDALEAEAAGADAIGVILFSRSPRNISPDTAREIFSALGPFTATVCVTHTSSMRELEAILDLNPSAIQIFCPLKVPSGTGVKVIRAVAPGDPLPADCEAVIIDASHGSGSHFNPEYALNVSARSSVPVILAGGLSPENVREAIDYIQPYAVDVASGVEVSPGIKDPAKVRAFIAACRKQ